MSDDPRRSPGEDWVIFAFSLLAPSDVVVIYSCSRVFGDHFPWGRRFTEVASSRHRRSR